MLIFSRDIVVTKRQSRFDMITTDVRTHETKRKFNIRTVEYMVEYNSLAIIVLNLMLFSVLLYVYLHNFIFTD